MTVPEEKDKNNATGTFTHKRYRVSKEQTNIKSFVCLNLALLEEGIISSTIVSNGNDLQ